MPATKSRLDELRELEPYEFEQFVANVWADKGWQTHVLPESNDYGIDVIATKSDPTPQKLLVQAKRYAEGNTIGSPAIQQYRSLLEQEPDADSVVIVTTSSFTSQAQEVADRMNVKLVDGNDLIRIIEEGSIPSTQPTTTSPTAGEPRGDDMRSLLWAVPAILFLDPERLLEVFISLFILLVFGYVFWEFLQVLIF